MRFFRDLILAGLGLLAVVLAMEGSLRVARDRTEASLFQAEAERGYALRPNATGWNIDDGEAWVRINRDGYRDRDRELRRPEGTLRIAIVGSSEVEEQFLPLDGTVLSNMERDLDAAAARNGQHVEVLNFGVAGYSLQQSYLTLRNHALRYDPQIVIVLANGFTVLKSAPEVFPGSPEATPFYRIRDGQLEPDDSAGPRVAPDPKRLALKNRLSDVMNQSYLLSLLNMAVVRWPLHMAPLRNALNRSAQGQGNSAPVEFLSVWPFVPDVPQTQRAWAVSEALLLAMRDESRSRGAEFYVVLVDGEVQVHPDPAFRAAYARRLGVPSLDLADRRFQAFGAANGIGVLPLAPVMREYAESHGVALHGGPRGFNEGHWNLLGSRIAAGAISRYLRAESDKIRRVAAPR